MASNNVLELTDQNFEQEVIKSDTPVLVDFWAEWCHPCRLLSRVIDELAGEYQGKVKVGKVNTDNNRDVPMKFGIQALPTVILFKQGQPVRKFVGLQDKKIFAAELDKLGT